LTNWKTVFIGFDPREVDAFVVAKHSAKGLSDGVTGLVLSDLQQAGLYWRPTERREGRLWDVISDAPMATEFAISRFLTPLLAGGGWALFMDCDVLIRHSLIDLFALADPTKAVQCVKHDHVPTKGLKMDGQLQTAYPRKNWSSVMLFNCEHPANEALTLDLINTVPGRDLHRFCWLQDDEIGELPAGWNHLVGHDFNPDPAIVHFTDGVPSMKGYEECAWSDEWRDHLSEWARGA
jgi:hypothetical protein